MTIAYFDCFSGISGDMALGALIDCGVPLYELRAGLASLPVAGWHLDARPILQNGIHATDVTITLDGKSDADELREMVASGALAESGAHEAHSHEHPHEHEHQHYGHEHITHDHDHDSHSHHGSHDHAHAHHAHHDHEHGQEHDHSHDHDHSHAGHSHTHEHSHEHVHGRSMAEIREIIEASGLSARVKQTSLDIFWRIAEVEAKMHHSTPEEIHFHEIGGVDSLIDICGVAWCLEYLGIERVYCSPLPYSTGFVMCAHGRMPVPAPATMELLKDVPMTPTEIQGEMVTPTGAGIVASLGAGFGPMPPMTPRKVGFGSGKKRFPDRPNMLRVVVGESAANTGSHQPFAAGTREQLAGLDVRTLSVVETNIDDMNPEFYEYVMERLFEAGALDVWLQPTTMKRNRPAVLLSALCAEGNVGTMVTAILSNTTSLGVRVSSTQRYALPREERVVETKYGPVRVKMAMWPEQGISRGIPEYADVKRLAEENRVSPVEVYNAAAVGRAE